MLIFCFQANLVTGNILGNSELRCKNKFETNLTFKLENWTMIKNWTKNVSEIFISTLYILQT